MLKMQINIKNYTDNKITFIGKNKNLKLKKTSFIVILEKNIR